MVPSAGRPCETLGRRTCANIYLHDDYTRRSVVVKSYWPLDHYWPVRMSWAAEPESNETCSLSRTARCPVRWCPTDQFQFQRTSITVSGTFCCRHSIRYCCLIPSSSACQQVRIVTTLFTANRLADVEITESVSSINCFLVIKFFAWRNVTLTSSYDDAILFYKNNLLLILSLIVQQLFYDSSSTCNSTVITVRRMFCVLSNEKKNRFLQISELHFLCRVLQMNCHSQCP